MLYKSGENRFSTFIPNLRGKEFSLSSLCTTLVMVFCRCPLSSWRSSLFLIIISEYWILSNPYSVSIDQSMSFFFFSLLIWCITLTDFQILNHPFIHGLNLAVYGLYNSFYVSLNSMCKYFAKCFSILLWDWLCRISVNSSLNI